MTAEAVGLYSITQDLSPTKPQLRFTGAIRSADANAACSRGEKINTGSRLSAVARDTKRASIAVDGENWSPVHAVLDKMTDCSNRVRMRALKGHTASAVATLQHRHRGLTRPVWLTSLNINQRARGFVRFPVDGSTRGAVQSLTRGDPFHRSSKTSAGT